jgi:type I restriction enzyme M protein
LARFKDIPLLDEYDVYEQLMTYWHAVVHDDVFLVMNENWVDAAKPRSARILGYDKNKKPKFEDADFQFGTGASSKRYVMDLIPPTLVVARYFPDEQEAVDSLNVAAEEAARAVEEYIEEHAVEEGILAEAVDDNGKVTLKSASACLLLAMSRRDVETTDAAKHILRLLKEDASAKKTAKDARIALNWATLRRYDDLTEPQIKQLVLDDKWHATIRTKVDHEVNSLTLDLVGRIQELGQRYGETVDDLTTLVAQLENRVAVHLTDMGVK